MDSKLNIEKGQMVFDPLNPHLGGNICGGDERCNDYAVWDYLIHHFKPKSICDVGCGEGHLMEHFYDWYVKVYGIDGLQANKDNGVEEIKEFIRINDYTKHIGPVFNVDMVLSCEFVEHVEERFIKNYLFQFRYCKTLVFTHALPGQAGHHHVNCQDDKYWIDLMTRYNFKYLPVETEYARSIIGWTFWGSLLIFKHV